MARSIVVWGGPPFLGPANSTHEEMARAFRALGCDVLYLELEGDARPFKETVSRSPGPEPGTARTPEGITLARIPKVPCAPYAMTRITHAVHMLLAERQLERLAPAWWREDPAPPGRSLALPWRSPVMIHRGWFSASLARAFRGARHVYDCVDDHAAAPEVAASARRVRRVEREEAKLVKACDLTVCVTGVLADARSAKARRCVVLPNASRPEMFEGEFDPRGQSPCAASREPEELAGLPRPRALFLGWLGPRVDMQLVTEAATSDPGIIWVFAGDVRGVSVKMLPENVRLLGPVRHDDMPALAAHSDVGIVPLRRDRWCRACSPMKIGDYLAAGLPVVSTPLPAAEGLAKELPEGVFLAESGEGFAKAVRGAASLGADVRETIRAYAREHTWRHRAEAMLRELDRVQAG